LRRLGPALAERDFALLWCALFAMGMGTQMLEVAIGWQVYNLTHRVFDLGLIGLAEFLPMFLLALPAGQLADHLPRRLVYGASLVFGALVALGLVAVTAAGVIAAPVFFALAFGMGTAAALGTR
jgi:MFS family permease